MNLLQQMREQHRTSQQFRSKTEIGVEHHRASASKERTYVDGDGNHQKDRRQKNRTSQPMMKFNAGSHEFEIPISDEQGQKAFEKGMHIFDASQTKLKSETLMNHASTFFLTAGAILMVIGALRGARHDTYRD